MEVNVKDTSTPQHVATLQTISLKGLRNKSADEISKLLLAAQKEGIFYLDLKDDDVETQLANFTNDINTLSREIFEMSYEAKMAFDIDTGSKYKLNGFKPIGRNIGGIDGQRDGFESYAISGNGLLLSPYSEVLHPPIVQRYKNSLAGFRTTCFDIASVIFQTLSTAFDVPGETSFQSCHDSSKSTLDVVRMLRYPNAMGSSSPTIPQPPHTDMGSLTFLFTPFAGLKILPSGTTEWLYVLPRENSPVINFGDAMNILSKGRFQSVLHRVVSSPGGAVEDRYSFAFLMRPEPSAHMVSLPAFDQDGCGKSSSGPTCEEWVARKFKQLRGA